MFTPTDVALALEKTVLDGFDVRKISKVAFEICQEHGLELTSSMDRLLLVLMAMEEGPEFELSEEEFFKLIFELKNNMS